MHVVRSGHAHRKNTNEKIKKNTFRVSFGPACIHAFPRPWVSICYDLTSLVKLCFISFKRLIPLSVKALGLFSRPVIFLIQEMAGACILHSPGDQRYTGPTRSLNSTFYTPVPFLASSPFLVHKSGPYRGTIIWKERPWPKTGATEHEEWE